MNPEGNGVGEVGATVPTEGAAPRRVAIVALGPSNLRYIQQASNLGSRAHYDEVWTVNSYADVIKSDRLFHMDDFLVQERRAEKNPRIAAMLEAIKRYSGPVYTCRPLPRYPTSIEYPLGPVIAAFQQCYFNNTVPYMAAYAGYIGVEEITFFGCDYSWPNRVSAEKGRACLEYWIGQLNARGVRTQICQESTLMDAQEYRNHVYPIYGYCDAHTVQLIPMDDHRIKMIITPKEELPTAEEMEAKYDHGQDDTPGHEIDVIAGPVAG